MDYILGLKWIYAWLSQYFCILFISHVIWSMGYGAKDYTACSNMRMILVGIEHLAIQWTFNLITKILI